MVTPFRGGAVDFAALGDLIDWQITQGTPVISPVGTTGESPTLSHEEHEQIIAFVVERVAGRAKVMAGTGSNATSEAVRLTRFARSAGADAALVVAPYYNRPSQEGIYRHFAMLAESVDLPMVIYNVPGRTGRNVDPATVERLARFTPIVAVKEASGQLDQVSELVGRTDLTILSGDDSLILPMMAVGATGAVSVVANLVPREVIALIAGVREGRLADAQSIHRRLFPLCRDLMGVAPNPIPLKMALALLGRGNGEMRLPLCDAGEAATRLLRDALSQFQLLS
jgi:4-hydroxy-tetrahydrodipicolinate synthase